MNIFVCSWNINSGGSPYKKNIKNLVNELDKKYSKDLKNSDILIIGLQEMNYKKLDIFSKKHGFILFETINTCKMPNFKVSTMIYHKNNINIKKLERVKKCYLSDGEKTSLFSGTKGMDFLMCDIIKNKKLYNLSIVNCHMPFKSIKSSSKYILNMINDTKNFNESKNIILMGDINSRSILTDDGYKKNIKCDEIEKCKTFFKIKDELEKIPFNKTYGISRKQKLLSILRNTDYFTNNILKKELNGFKERKITFLPTYKRNKTGMFKLSKNDKLRLPGYADRIIYKGNKLQQKKYTSIGVNGSDHLPLISLFHIKK